MNSKQSNIGLEPSRPWSHAIMSRRRAAQAAALGDGGHFTQHPGRPSAAITGELGELGVGELGVADK